MTKILIIMQSFIVLLFQPLYSQQYVDSTYNRQERIRVSRFLKYNYKEQLCEFYDNDTVRLKLIGTLNQFNNWNIETVLEEWRYINRRLKRTGFLLVIRTSYRSWETPINRHVYYRRNGKIKTISRFSNYGIPLYDSLFYRSGAPRKTVTYTK